MARKYQKFDQQLFAWLQANRENITTARVIDVLGIDDTTIQRHVSRRFTQLEDRGILKCSLRGTTRVCTVVQDLPADFATRRWNPVANSSRFNIRETPLPVGGPIRASNSEEFLAAGGIIETIPTNWDRPLKIRPWRENLPYDLPEDSE